MYYTYNYHHFTTIITTSSQQSPPHHKLHHFIYVIWQRQNKNTHLMNKQFCNILYITYFWLSFISLKRQFKEMQTALHIPARETNYERIESLMMLCKLCTCAYNPRCTNEKWIVKYFEEKIIAWFTISPASDKYGFYEYLP